MYRRKKGGNRKCRDGNLNKRTTGPRFFIKMPCPEERVLNRKRLAISTDGRAVAPSGNIRGIIREEIPQKREFSQEKGGEDARSSSCRLFALSLRAREPAEKKYHTSNFSRADPFRAEYKKLRAKGGESYVWRREAEGKKATRISCGNRTLFRGKLKTPTEDQRTEGA